MLTDFQELWPASRRKPFPKYNELQSINVVKTCEKLRLALTQACNGLQRTQDILYRRTVDELSFRSISQLCYTTLRIHELQVNDLLNKSKELIAQSKDWSTVQAKKRSQSSSYSTAYCAKRKRRATVELSLQDATITNYTQLLDETAEFVEWGKKAEIVNKKVSKTNSHSRTTCIHIREITINEIDTTHNEHYSIDADDGFGNTTGDELATLIQLLSDEPPKAPKRKAVEILGACEKKAKNSIALQEVDEMPDEIEAPRSSHIENETTNLFIPAGNNNCDEFSPVHAEMSIISSKGAIDNDTCIEIPKSSKLDKSITATNAMDTMCYYQKERLVSNVTLNKQRSNHNKTIIDACTALKQSEMRAQVQTEINIKAKLNKSRAKVKWHNGKYMKDGKRYDTLLPSAKELLTTFYHNGTAFRKFKLKKKVRRSSLETSTASAAYRNLLREILNREITDDLATQIYEKSNHFEKFNRKSINSSTNYRSYENAQVVQDDTYFNERLLLPNNIMEFEIFYNNNNLHRVNRNCSPSSEQDEWGAYDVMIKLLNMWRSEIVLDDEISVKLLFPQTIMSRKTAAKGFGALLRLAANGFIRLFTAEHSKHLQCIKLGAASNKLIQRNGLNNEIVSRRSNNRFRISVS